MDYDVQEISNPIGTKDHNINTHNKGNDVRVYKQRWIVLILFILNNIAGSIHVMQYNVVTDVIRQYYQVSYTAIEWTSMIYSLLYAVLVLPGSHIFEKMGVRNAVLIGSIGMLMGTCIKLGSVHPDRFWVTFLGQTVVVIFQVCQYPLLPKLAATWFGYNQIATACGFGVVGYQIGMSLSYLLPPIFVKGSNSEIEYGLNVINISYAALNGFVLLLLIFGFSNSPPTPPSIAQENYTKEREENPVRFSTAIKSLFTNKNYIIFIIIESINMASVTPFLVLSNQIILTHYNEGTYHVGILGVLNMGCGIVGSMGSSVLMDKFKKCKLITIVAHILLGLSILLYTTTLTQGMHCVYISSVLMGIFYGSLMTIGMEVVVELTYPRAQNLAVGIYVAFVEISAILVTSIFGPVFRSFGFYYASAILLAGILVADFLFIFMKFDLRRQAAQLKGNEDMKIS